MSNNKSNITVLHSETWNPWFNLATEDWIFNDMEPEGHVLFLWGNSETVVIGRNQNPWVECRLETMEKEGVKLARRQSGGGAVYQDKKNLNFTFMSGIKDYSIERNFKIIISALSQFGIKAEVSGRNDLIVDGKKISGSAFKKKTDRAFHHGTLLIDVDLSRLSNYLNPDKKKLEAKGIKSVKSRVANLSNFNSEIDAEKLKKVITREFYDLMGSGEEKSLDLNNLKEFPKLMEYYKLMKSENWLYQRTPQFNHRIDRRYSWGGIEILLDVKKAVIDDVIIFSDSLYPDMIMELIEKLKGTAYLADALATAVADLNGANPAWSSCLKDIIDALIEEIG